MKIAAPNYILSIDLGTSGVKASIWDDRGKMVCGKTLNVPRVSTENGFVEQDPNLLWNEELKAIKLVVRESRISPDELRTIGIANQRESAVAWNKNTGKPLYNVISWMDRRTSLDSDLVTDELESYVKERTGLRIDPYFSASKMAWLIRHLKKKYGNGLESFLKLGTLDSWLVWKLTAGKSHTTDWSNASRTMLFDIRRGKWDARLLEEFNVHEGMLPEVVDSIDPGITTDRSVLGSEIEIGGIAGDQQASLFGHLALEEGEMKNTYGTGSFLLVNAGSRVPKTERLISTVAWKERGKKPVYAVEGSVFSTGSLIDWAIRNLNLVDELSDFEKLAKRARVGQGLYFVPAIEGLGAPYWNRSARGGILGMTSVTTKAEMIKAIQDSIAYRARDIIEQVKNEIGLKGKTLKVDGKLCGNGTLMQFQADLIGMPLLVHGNTELTSAGAAFLAAKAQGNLDIDQLRENLGPVNVVRPTMKKREADRYYGDWKRAVQVVLKMYT